MRFHRVAIAIFMLILSFQWQGMALQKKTVCTVTINSSDEKEIFQRTLPQNKFEFVELTENVNKDDKSQSDWLINSCKKGISCDILVVSGHFGGRFFGSSNKELTLEALEKASCESSCRGIIKKPKEVFLFGCNTLAGKIKDNRTPEEYRQVLMNDGFSQSEASSISAYRYSPFGSSFADRMSRVFSETPQIYGFSAVAPSGKHITESLSGYLNQEKDTYFDRMVGYINSADASLNNISLASYFRQTTFTQASGKSTGALAVCYLSSKNVSHKDKLNWVLQALNSDNLLSNISDISRYLKALTENDLKDLSSIERSLFEKIQISEAKKEQLLNFTKIKEAAFIFPQMAILQLMKFMHWLPEKRAEQLITNALLGDVLVWTGEKRDLISSLNVPAPNLRLEQLPTSVWKNSYFIESLAALRPKDPQIHSALLKALSSADDKVRSRAAWVLGQFKSRELGAQLSLVAALEDSSPMVRYHVVEALKEIEPKDSKVLLALVARIRSSNAIIRARAASVLIEIKPTEIKVLEALTTLLKNSNPDVRSRAAWVLEKISF